MTRALPLNMGYALLSIAIELWLRAADQQDCALLSRAIQVKRSILITCCRALIWVRSFLPAASAKLPSPCGPLPTWD